MKDIDKALFVLTMPPTLNWLFAWVWKKRYKSEEYVNWLKLANIELKKQDTIEITGDNWLEFDLRYFFSLYTKQWAKRIKDTANYEKATVDFLSSKVKWLQDHKIKKITQEKIDSDLNVVEIRIKEI